MNVKCCGQRMIRVLNDMKDVACVYAKDVAEWKCNKCKKVRKQRLRQKTKTE